MSDELDRQHGPLPSGRHDAGSKASVAGAAGPSIYANWEPGDEPADCLLRHLAHEREGRIDLRLVHQVLRRTSP